MSKTYTTLVCGIWCIFAGSSLATAQVTTSADANRPTCAALLANDSTVGTRIGPSDSARRAPDTTTRPRSDTTTFGIGGARTGPGDVILLVGVHADQVRFASLPH